MACQGRKKNAISGILVIDSSTYYVHIKDQQPDFQKELSALEYGVSLFSVGCQVITPQNFIVNLLEMELNTNGPPAKESIGGVHALSAKKEWIIFVSS